VLPGRLTLTRRVQNVSGARRTFNAFPLDNSTSRIDVQPRTFALNHGRSQLLTITIYADADTSAQQFGSIELRSSGLPNQHIPVAFIKTQGSVSLTQTCGADELYVEQATTCTVVATNNGFEDQEVDLDTRLNDRLWLRATSGATMVNRSHARLHNVTLAGAEPGVPSLSVYGPLGDGYFDLDNLDIPHIDIGDEEAINFNVPEFLFNGVAYDSIGVVSNGYIVAGGATAEDINCCTLPAGPSDAPPNNVLSPFWADLDGTDAPGIQAEVLTDGVNEWIVVEFEVFAFGTDDLKVFQVWIGINGVQDITFNYDPDHTNLDGVFMGEGGGLLVGAENEIGQGEMIKDTVPTTDLVVESTDPEPGQSAVYSMRVKGIRTGFGAVTTSMVASGVPGTTIEQDGIQVLAP
jgi:hypothetical protein